MARNEHPDYPADVGPERCALCGQSLHHFTMGDHQRYGNLLVAANGWSTNKDGSRTSLKEARKEEAVRYKADRDKFARVMGQAHAAGDI